MHIKFKTYAMQASTWICTSQMQPIKVHELAPPTRVLLLSKNFDPLIFFNVDPSLSVHVQLLLLYLNLYLKLSSLCTISPPLSSIFIKGVLLIDAKACFWVDGWGLYLAFLWTSLDYWNDTTCIASWDTTHRIFDLDTSWWDTSP